VSAQTQRILSTLGIPLIHSRVGKPAGRGKIERYHRTVREQFLRPLDVESLKSLEDLELRFHSWLESEYHRSPHRGLDGKTPLEVWVERAERIIAIDPTLDYGKLFFHQTDRKVHKDSTVTLDGVLYEVSSLLIGERVSLAFDPDLSPEKRVLYLCQAGKDCGTARKVDSYANARVRRGSLTHAAVVDSTQEQDPLPDAAGSAPSSVEAHLSASRIRLESAESEEQSR
jgi:putative transposase